jgi:hypothetical protein
MEKRDESATYFLPIPLKINKLVPISPFAKLYCGTKV